MKTGEALICKMTLDTIELPSGEFYVVKRVWHGPALANMKEAPQYRDAWGPFYSSEVADQVSGLIAPGEQEEWQKFLARELGAENVVNAGHFRGGVATAEMELAVEAGKARLAGGVVEEVL